MNEVSIRQLVELLVETLGPETPPDRIEATARAVMGINPAKFAEPPPLPAVNHPSGDRVIITAFGCDSPGILAEITRVVSEIGANILDVSQKILQGYFTLIMLADMRSANRSVQNLQMQLSETGDRLQVRILVQHEELFYAMHRP